MANPYRGEVEFTVNKKVYTLRYSINAMVELEKSLGGSILDLANQMSDVTKLSITKTRTLFWAGLRDFHESVTEEDAGRLMSEVGLNQSMELIGKAFTQAFPDIDTNRPLEKSKAVLSGKAH